MQGKRLYLIDPQTEKERESELYCYIQHLIQIGKISVFDFSLETRLLCPHFYFAEFFRNRSHDTIQQIQLDAEKAKKIEQFFFKDRLLKILDLFPLIL